MSATSLARRIHILGLGSIGLFVAHSLRSLPLPPPITILLHRQGLYADYEASGKRIRLHPAHRSSIEESSGYDVEVLQMDNQQSSFRWLTPATTSNTGSRDECPVGHGGEIECLIVAVKASATIDALRSVKQRLTSRSTICLVQNGMGQVEELNKSIFMDSVTRPTYILGIASQGVYRLSPFHAKHAGTGKVALAVYGADEAIDYSKRISTQALLTVLQSCLPLACDVCSPSEFQQRQFEKLAVNCVINPITALLDIPNGAIIRNNHLTGLSEDLIEEISSIFRKLPELKDLENVQDRFSSQALKDLVGTVGSLTALNSSSMREDVRNGRITEINYLNGYLVRRAHDQNLPCPLNSALARMVLGKTDYRHNSTA